MIESDIKMVIKAGNPWLYIKLLIFASVFAMVYWNLPGWSSQNYILLICLLAFTAVILAIPNLSKVYIQKDGFEKIAFTGKRKIKWQEIESIDYKIKYHFFGWNTFLVLKLKGGLLYNFPLNYFSKQKIRLFLSELFKAQVKIKTSDKVKNMAAGKFPLYFF